MNTSPENAIEALNFAVEGLPSMRKYGEFSGLFGVFHDDADVGNRSDLDDGL
jgi:hypothetical protein